MLATYFSRYFSSHEAEVDSTELPLCMCGMWLWNQPESLYLPCYRFKVVAPGPIATSRMIGSSVNEVSLN